MYTSHEPRSSQNWILTVCSNKKTCQSQILIEKEAVTPKGRPGFPDQSHLIWERKDMVVKHNDEANGYSFVAIVVVYSSRVH